MSILGEHEADAFFHEGDAGTYDGGPARSLVPVSTVDLLDDEEDGATLPSPEQLARRERFKRLVTTGMTTLAACSALVFALRGTRTDAGTASTSSPSTEQARTAARPSEVVAAPVVAKAVPVVDAPLIDAPPLPPVEAAPVVAPGVALAAVAAAHVERARVASSAAVAPVAKSAVTSNPMRAAERASAHGESVSSSTQVAPASLPAVFGRPTVVMMATTRSTTSGHAPPTATFPD